MFSSSQHVNHIFNPTPNEEEFIRKHHMVKCLLKSYDSDFKCIANEVIYFATFSEAAYWCNQMNLDDKTVKYTIEVLEVG